MSWDNQQDAWHRENTHGLWGHTHMLLPVSTYSFILSKLFNFSVPHFLYLNKWDEGYLLYQISVRIKRESLCSPQSGKYFSNN